MSSAAISWRCLEFRMAWRKLLQYGMIQRIEGVRWHTENHHKHTHQRHAQEIAIDDAHISGCLVNQRLCGIRAFRLLRTIGHHTFHCYQSFAKRLQRFTRYVIYKVSKRNWKCVQLNNSRFRGRAKLPPRFCVDILLMLMSGQNNVFSRIRWLPFGCTYFIDFIYVEMLVFATLVCVTDGGYSYEEVTIFTTIFRWEEAIELDFVPSMTG